MDMLLYKLKYFNFNHYHSKSLKNYHTNFGEIGMFKHVETKNYIKNTQI